MAIGKELSDEFDVSDIDIEIRGFKACFWFNVCNDSCTFSYSLQQRNTCPCCCCCCSNLQKVSNVNQLPCSHVNMSKTLISIYHAVYVWFLLCDQLYITNACHFDFFRTINLEKVLASWIESNIVQWERSHVDLC